MRRAQHRRKEDTEDEEDGAPPLPASPMRRVARTPLLQAKSATKAQTSVSSVREWLSMDREEHDASNEMRKTALFMSEYDSEERIAQAKEARQHARAFEKGNAAILPDRHKEHPSTEEIDMELGEEEDEQIRQWHESKIRYGHGQPTQPVKYAFVTVLAPFPSERMLLPPEEAFHRLDLLITRKYSQTMKNMEKSQTEVTEKLELLEKHLQELLAHK